MITVTSRGIDDLERLLARTPAAAAKAQSMTINTVAAWATVQAKRQFLNEVNLPADTLTKARFGIRQTATSTRPEAVISASDNPLGLSRFVVGPKRPGLAGPSTRIKRGGKTTVWPDGKDKGDYAFLLATPGGNGGVALAIRTKRPLTNSREALQIRPGLYILSGPSVNQMFGNIAPALIPAIEARMQAEFARQYARLIRG